MPLPSMSCTTLEHYLKVVHNPATAIIAMLDFLEFHPQGKPEKMKLMKLKEIKHGRIAMIAVAGQAAAARLHAVLPVLHKQLPDAPPHCSQLRAAHARQGHLAHPRRRVRPAVVRPLASLKV